MPPRNQLIFDLLQQLRILTPEESQKVGLRYNEAGGTHSLVEFLIEGGYIGLGHIGRLAAMERSSGGSLSPDEREALQFLREEMIAHQDALGTPSAQSTHHDHRKAGSSDLRKDLRRETERGS